MQLGSESAPTVVASGFTRFAASSTFLKSAILDERLDNKTFMVGIEIYLSVDLPSSLSRMDFRIFSPAKSKIVTMIRIHKSTRENLFQLSADSA